MQDDPYTEREYDWNLWQIYDDYAQLIGSCWRWGIWCPVAYTWFQPFPITGLEVAEEGHTYPLDLDGLLVRIRAWIPPH